MLSCQLRRIRQITELIEEDKSIRSILCICRHLHSHTHCVSFSITSHSCGEMCEWTTSHLTTIAGKTFCLNPFWPDQRHLVCICWYLDEKAWLFVRLNRLKLNLLGKNLSMHLLYIWTLKTYNCLQKMNLYAIPSKAFHRNYCMSWSQWITLQRSVPGWPFCPVSMNNLIIRLLGPDRESFSKYLSTKE